MSEYMENCWQQICIKVHDLLTKTALCHLVLLLPSESGPKFGFSFSHGTRLTSRFYTHEMLEYVKLSQAPPTMQR